MFNATYFTYDGIYSAVYGLKIATLNDETITNAGYAIPNLSFSKPAKSNKFYYKNKEYTEPFSQEFSIICENPIPDIVEREILAWLDSRNDFKQLIIHTQEFESVTYNCIFTITNIIQHLGNCIGFTIKATFDSIYCYGRPIVKTVNNTSENVVTINFVNTCDILDDYVYPTVEFIPTAKIDGDKIISIINETDSQSREFYLEDVDNKLFGLNNKICVNNTNKTLSSETGEKLLSKFNKNWLRLKHGKNVLKIKINGTCKITCPNYIKIRF